MADDCDRDMDAHYEELVADGIADMAMDDLRESRDALLAACRALLAAYRDISVRPFTYVPIHDGAADRAAAAIAKAEAT